MPDFNTMEQTFSEVTRSVDQLCNQFSLIGLAIPKFEGCSDVFDFVAEFENLTTSLPDEQKAKLLFKAFPPGKYRPWFETELKPAISNGSPWNELMDKLIRRFSSTEDRDRHFTRLHKLEFKQGGSQKLLDYVEDVVYSYKRAYTSGFDDEACVRFIKTSLPSELLANLNMIAEFKAAKRVTDLVKAVKTFDDSRAGLQSSNADEKLKISELTGILKELINKSAKDYGKVIAAIQSLPERMPIYPRSPKQERRPRSTERWKPGQSSPPDSRDRSRERYRDKGHQGTFRERAEYNKGYKEDYGRMKSKYQSPERRGTSPQVIKRDRYHSRSPTRRPNDVNQSNKTYEDSKRAFDDQKYFSKFGIPPTPCTYCGSWHWSRHCIDHLN